MSKKQLGRPLEHPDGVKKSYSVSLNHYQNERIKNKYGSLTNALTEIDRQIVDNSIKVEGI